MVKYILGRVGRALITMSIVLTIVFLLMRLLPVDTYFEGNTDTMSDTVKNAILSELGLLDPWYVQLGHFWKNLILHFDVGNSIVIRKGSPLLGYHSAQGGRLLPVRHDRPPHSGGRGPEPGCFDGEEQGRFGG